MSSEQFTSIRVVIDRILRDHIFDGLSFEQALDYCLDFIDIVGVPNTFIQKEVKIRVGEDENGLDNPETYYRAPLPADFVSMVQLMIHQTPARYATDTLHEFYYDNRVTNNYDSYPAYDHTYLKAPDLTYKISNGIIYVSEKKCKIHIIYEAIPIVTEGDDAGLPMIPENRTFMRALQTYIELQHLRILWRNGKITDKVYQDAEQQYDWAVGAWETDARKLDPSKAESFYNMWSTLLPRSNEFANRFRGTGAKEILRRK